MIPIYFLIAVLVVGLTGFALLTAWGKKSGLSDSQREKIKEVWNSVELLMADDREASWAKAVFEADKLLDYVMTLRRIPGSNMGERLKNGRHLFSNVQSAWDAHKLRNQLAHEVDMKLMRHEADRAIRLFKDGLRQLGAGI
jgi:hypothetical protein